MRHHATLLAGQIEGLASKIEDLQTAEAVSIGRAARAAQETERHMQEATEAIGGQLKVQLETTMADERRCEFTSFEIHQYIFMQLLRIIPFQIRSLRIVIEWLFTGCYGFILRIANWIREQYPRVLMREFCWVHYAAGLEITSRHLYNSDARDKVWLAPVVESSGLGRNPADK